MPPKSPAKGKKKKKTKAELEIERQLAEEEAKRLEEEQRRKEEEQRKKEEEEYRQLKKRQAEYREGELARLAAEVTAHEEDQAEKAEQLYLLEREDKAHTSWGLYMNCDRKPNATSEKELNTFLSEQAETQTAGMDKALENLNYTEAIVGGLLDVAGACAAEGNEAGLRKATEFVHALRESSSRQLDHATAHLLQYWDEFIKEASQINEKDEGDKMCTHLGGVRVGVWCNLAMKGFRIKTIDFPEAGMSTDVPRPLSIAKVALRNVFLPYEHIPTAERPIGGAVPKKVVLGGVFILELLALPPGLKKMKGWVVRPVTELSQQILRHPYPIDGGNAAVAPPLRAQYHIPEGVVIPESPMVACWDPEFRLWVPTGIEECEWNPEKRTIKFHTTKVGIIAAVQDRAADLCYKSWSLTPVYNPADEDGSLAGEEDKAEPEVRFEIETLRMRVVISIRGTECRLLGPDLPDLRHICERVYESGQLTQALLRAGVIICPIDADRDRAQLPKHKDPGVTLKDKTLEQSLCTEVASIAASFEVKGSRWSCLLGAKRCALNVRETSAFTGGNADLIDYKLALVEMDEASNSAADAPHVGVLPKPGVKCYLTKGQEDSTPLKPLDTTTAPGEETHIYLLECLKSSSTTEALDRARNSSLRFQKTVTQMLRLVRPFSFS